MVSVTAALKSIDRKKGNLRKAIEELKHHSSLLLSSLKLQSTCSSLKSLSKFLHSFVSRWEELDEDLEDVQKFLEERFNEIEAKEKGLDQRFDELKAMKKKKNKKKKKKKKKKLLLASKVQALDVEEESERGLEDDDDESEPEPVVREELKELCVNMDGMGLRSFLVGDNRKLPLPSLPWDEVGEALKYAPDPADMILDALDGFYPPGFNRYDYDPKLDVIRRMCAILLDQLNDIHAQLKPPVKEKAFKLAVEWKGKIDKESEKSVEALAFLHLLSTYGLASAFDADELIDIAICIVRRKKAFYLYTSLGLADKMPDLIKKLCDNGCQLDAVKVAYAFELVEEFPPVSLIKSYLDHSVKLAEDILKAGSHSLEAQRQAMATERAALKGIVKCIQEHNLELEYPLDSLQKRYDQVKKKPKVSKRPTVAPEQWHESTSECLRPTSSDTSSIMGTSVPLSETPAQHNPLSLDKGNKLKRQKLGLTTPTNIPEKPHENSGNRCPTPISSDTFSFMATPANVPEQQHEDSGNKWPEPLSSDTLPVMCTQADVPERERQHETSGSKCATALSSGTSANVPEQQHESSGNKCPTPISSDTLPIMGTEEVPHSETQAQQHPVILDKQPKKLKKQKPVRKRQKHVPEPQHQISGSKRPRPTSIDTSPIEEMSVVSPSETQAQHHPVILGKQHKKLKKEKPGQGRPKNAPEPQHQNSGSKRPRPTSIDTSPIEEMSVVSPSETQAQHHSVILDEQHKKLKKEKPVQGHPKNAPEPQHQNSGSTRLRQTSQTSLGTLPNEGTCGVPHSKAQAQHHPVSLSLDLSSSPQFRHHPLGLLPQSQHGTAPRSNPGLSQYMTSAYDPYGTRVGANSVHYSLLHPSAARPNLYSKEQHASSTKYHQASLYDRYDLPPSAKRHPY